MTSNVVEQMSEVRYFARPKRVKYMCKKFLKPKVTSIDISEGCGGPSYRNDFDNVAYHTAEIPGQCDCHGNPVYPKDQGVTEEEWDCYLKEIDAFKSHVDGNGNQYTDRMHL